MIPIKPYKQREHAHHEKYELVRDPAGPVQIFHISIIIKRMALHKYNLCEIYRPSKSLENPVAIQAAIINKNRIADEQCGFSMYP